MAPGTNFLPKFALSRQLPNVGPFETFPCDGLTPKLLHGLSRVRLAVFPAH
jgi:hypothetical protein